VVVVLFIAGDHVPVILFVDVVGKLKVPPEQIGATWLKEGVTVGFTVTLIVVDEAHCPVFGVNVYVVVVVLLMVGDQVPDIPLIEEDGKVKVPPEQIGAI
jgi:hypothetical protein